MKSAGMHRKTLFYKVTANAVLLSNRARYHKGFRTMFVNIPAAYNEHAEDEKLVAATLAAGLYPKILTTNNDTGGLKTLTGGQAISIVSGYDRLEKQMCVRLTGLDDTASQLGQLPHENERIRSQSYRVLHHHAIEEGTKRPVTYVDQGRRIC